MNGKYVREVVCETLGLCEIIVRDPRFKKEGKIFKLKKKRKIPNFEKKNLKTKRRRPKLSLGVIGLF
jgi:hypothetical protein